MYRKSGQGYVLVITDATHKVATGKLGIGGKEIIADIIFNPVQYVNTFAEVICVPVEMGKTPFNQVPIGSPGYGPIRRPADLEEACSTDIYAIGGVYSYKYVSDIIPEVQIGDKIYFRPRTLNSPKNCMGTLKDEKGKPAKYIYKVPYENILCAVRGERMIMIGSWTLLDPLYEDWDDILVKTYYDYLDPTGQKIERPKKEWIQRKVAPSFENQRARIAHIGQPLKGEYCDFEVGETVIFKKQQQVFFQFIEGKKYIVLSQDQILCSVSEDATVTVK